jgi:hypothetical protein
MNLCADVLLLMSFLICAAITIGVRILGPAAGFILGSFCTRFYVNDLTKSNFGIEHVDPKWIGAWWLGKCF